MNSNYFRDKNILITGGTGSFGKACAQYLLENDICNKVIIFSRDEWKQWQMQQSNPLFSSSKIRYFLGDVRDKERLERAFTDVQIVIHAAALKQVPAAEYNPSEFVKTNVNGAMNIIDAAINAGIQKVMGLSTDKAVNPVNLYGATKLCSDKLLISGNAYVGKKGEPTFSVVRYGNVLGSRGSLLPHWQAILAEGKKSLPITDVRMTRFWITLTDAVKFVLQCIEEAVGGEIFIPKSPSVKIVDLAKAIAPDAALDICGIRPGEKLHELLVSQDDARQTFESPNRFTVAPLASSKAFQHYLALEKQGKVKRTAEDFVLSSNKNPLFTDSIEEIRNYLNTFLNNFLGQT
ncbi:MAG: UDP-N-acetylglucosamine 4,6-dehydratase (inverting) [Verrucomicrobia bacterium]|nr:UDP-N-acetylglucosamine 4,6-dehydratase (inverting) [Verrucomicrobiota bacterium]MBS0635923.1 UDP-N-acetylglucosamine 4,6-dehydratase (inverting) [Verrucomicrobiota bacterium]